MTTRVAWILVGAGSILAACSYTLPTVDTSQVCGNGVVDDEESCDDGNLINGDECDSNCTPTTCGNGIPTEGEACDDGNGINEDNCTNACIFASCGDRFIQPGEECDDGNAIDGDGCDSDCTSSRCGNSVHDPTEVCDDGNTDNGDGCNSSCRLIGQSSVFIGTLGVAGYSDGTGEAAQLSDRPLMTIHKGIMYFTGANTVRMVNIETREVTTIAGAGGISGYTDDPTGLVARFGSIEGLATDGTTLWVADSSNRVLRAVSLTPPYAVSTVAGKYDPSVNGTSADGVGLEAQFDDIRGLAYHNGRVYILDSDAGVLQAFNPTTAEVKTVAGQAYNLMPQDGNGIEARFAGPRLLTSNGRGLLYISDSDGESIRGYEVGTRNLFTVVGSATACGYVDAYGATAQLNRPRGIATDGESIYFVEQLAQTIRQVVVATKQVTTLSGTPLDCASNCMCAFGMAGSYAEGIGAAAQWNNPLDIAFDPKSRSLFVSDSNNFIIRRIE